MRERGKEGGRKGGRGRGGERRGGREGEEGEGGREGGRGGEKDLDVKREGRVGWGHMERKGGRREGNYLIQLSLQGVLLLLQFHQLPGGLVSGGLQPLPPLPLLPHLCTHSLVGCLQGQLLLVLHFQLPLPPR